MDDWLRRWWTSPEGREYRRGFFRLHGSKLPKDGTIRVEDVPPGAYRLDLMFTADPILGGRSGPERIARATRRFTIPEIPGGRSDEPFDLGELRPTPNKGPGEVLNGVVQGEFRVGVGKAPFRIEFKPLEKGAGNRAGRSPSVMSVEGNRGLTVA